MYTIGSIFLEGQKFTNHRATCVLYSADYFPTFSSFFDRGVGYIGQVAQLWQRDREKLDTFSINVRRYSQNHAQNGIFGPPYGASGAIYALYLKVLAQSNLVAEFHRENFLLLVKQRIGVSEPPLGGLGVTYAIDL